MLEILQQYGLFLAEAITVVIAIVVTAGVVLAMSRRGKAPERLTIKHLNEKYEDTARKLNEAILAKKALKQRHREDKVRTKQAAKAPPRRRVFVLDFHGDIKASAVASLREELSAVLAVATTGDEIVVRLENAGGLVHEHGLAASQLLRVRERGIPLTVAVDKVAASGGYLMACVAQRIIAAPFAIVGSIGVLAQLPNFHRLLEQRGIEVEQIKAGEYKRTLTMFGKNTEQDRTRLKEEIEDTHRLFKDFVHEQRPSLDIERVATGEHWYGRRALEHGLVDELLTSDDYLLNATHDADLYEVSYSVRKSLTDRLVSAVSGTAGVWSQRGPWAH